MRVSGSSAASAAKTWTIKHGALSPDILKSLVAAGSVGAVNDQYLDREGRVLDHEINERTISVPLDIIRDVPQVILAAGGSFKVPIIRAIMKANLIDVLITDERAARLLLNQPSWG
ncbi:MAG: hypothetical protein FJW24_02725 [Acidimicrobiia bacterium]|nr:hypothetical protein [Acidimicrobiia bacterium]